MIEVTEKAVKEIQKAIAEEGLSEGYL